MLKVLQIFNANATMIPQHQHNTDNCIMLSRLVSCFLVLYHAFSSFLLSTAVQYLMIPREEVELDDVTSYNIFDNKYTRYYHKADILSRKQQN